MPRPVPSPSSSPSSASPDGGFLCERMQQFRQRMRSRCLAAASASGAESTEAGAIPCLLQSWRRRIEAMDDEQQQTHRHHRGHRHHRRACHAAASTESSATESDESSPSSPPPACGGFPFRGPRMLHPKLERQQAACSLSGIWDGFRSSSSAASPPPSPEIYAKPRHRRHPYARCVDTAADDHGKSSATE
ncbi:hypothetical protein PR003_g14374 [Phytophthora rubi]|uniref:Uncharacterized protein n=1 Tax=Phytophthora rubi TaxID=129364 RepID=A0A6A3LIJ5_9STRA|nr:hypothetical protein PR002_g18383 [Phytophthora rubi]KAE9015994.1 hypothetical protein PR001_g14754 [Phytophthora rubi]KAE9332712.1 hypothetical protein PR003_g14374 [Phytophthora rubi]